MPARLTAPASRSRWLGIIAFALILLMATIALPVWGTASTVRTDTTVEIDTAEVIRDDLYVMSDTFTLDGRAERDVAVAARSVDISGRIVGSLNVAGAETAISGSVGHSVRVVGGNITVSGTINGDLLVVGGTTQIEDGAQIDGDLHVYSGTLNLLGTVGGDLSGTVGNLDLDGEVRGSVSTAVERISIGNDARIDGDLQYQGPTSANIPTAAEIGGVIDRDSIAPWGVGDSIRAKFFSPLVRTVWLLVTGSAIIALAPRLASALNDNLRRPLIAGLTGLIAMVGIPALAILLMITIVGIPASMLLLTVYIIALYLSQYIVGQRIGAWVLPNAWNDGSRGFLLLSMTIGVVALGVLRYLPVPFIGSIVNLLIAILGIGSAVLLLRQLRPRHVVARA